jgi:beta-ribofuranosylaminobenzene 5'-phosphate synthase
MTQAVQNQPQRRVHVNTTARLHMGFIDLNGGLGRRFGSIGLSLDKPSTSLAAEGQDDFSAAGIGAQRIVEFAKRFADRAGLRGGAHFEVAEAIPEHAGLGSGTQLALAVGVALARLYGLDLSPREIAALTARGARSGIGIGAFEQGGLLVDGGRGRDTQIPPLLARMAFPEQWRVLLVYDLEFQGVHGKQEVQAFGELPEFPAAQSAHIARLVLMRALPAVAEQDLENFGCAISELQRIVGDYFALAQGGGRYASPDVADAMAWLEAQGVHCTGQSSWGPTGFAVVGSEAQAVQLLQGMQRRGTRLKYEICRARNTGSIVEEGERASGHVPLEYSF